MVRTGGTEIAEVVGFSLKILVIHWQFIVAVCPICRDIVSNLSLFSSRKIFPVVLLFLRITL